MPYKVFNPGGVVIDTAVGPGRAYVWDSANKRILGMGLERCYEGGGPCTADVVIGQPSGYDHSACNGESNVQSFPVRARPMAETLYGILDHSQSPGEAHSFVTMAVDEFSNLYVPDSRNNRILKYENPFEEDNVADRVWGQEDFSGMTCNRGDFGRPTAETLCFHSATNQLLTNWYGNGVEIDESGNMWVADGGNNRVLRFSADPNSGEIAEVPDLVLGQPDFHGMGAGDALDELHGPSAVRVSDAGWVYVADTINDRILVFKPPFRSGMLASIEFGSDFHRPTSLEIDPLDRGVWIVDAGNFMVELWDPAGVSVVQILGKDQYVPDRTCGGSLTELPGNPRMCPISGSVGFYGVGNVLVPVYQDTADVLRLSTLMLDGEDGSMGTADMRLFYPPPNSNCKDRIGLHSARGVATWRDQLIVADRNRLLFWNGLDTLSNGKPADGVIGDEFAVEDWHFCCGKIKVDEAGRLWVLGFEGRGFLDVYQLPLTEYSAPLHTTWIETASFSVLGANHRTRLGHRVFGIAPVGNGDFLWLSDTDNHRVLRIRNPLTDPVVDVVLGQKDADGNACNRGLFPEADTSAFEKGENSNVLCFPGALSIDNLGNLYVSDHALEVSGNRRLLIYSAEATPTNNTEPILAPTAMKVFMRSAVGPNNLWADPWEQREVIPRYSSARWGEFAAATWEPAFDSKNRMAVGYNAYVCPRFAAVYEDPLGPEGLPTSFLHDFGSMFYAAAFDDNDNLYLSDINRGRLLVYWNPFSNTRQSAEHQVPEASYPEYPISIRSLSPVAPSCIIRDSQRSHETTLQLLVEGMSEAQHFTLEFRKLISVHREPLDVGPGHMSQEGSIIRVGQSSLWDRLWAHLDRVVLTVRIVERGYDGVVLSNWSPAFVLADDPDDCGIVAAR